jgi:hypothetical protein
MTSVLTKFAQRDNRLEQITLTGYIQNNGTIDTGTGNSTQQPAYAEINLTKAKNFLIDTRILRLRTDPGGEGMEYLLRIYMTPTKPPLFHQNFDWTIIIRLPQTSLNYLAIEVFNTKAEAESVDNNFLFELSNETPDGTSIWPGNSSITMQVVNNNYILKSTSPNLYYG